MLLSLAGRGNRTVRMLSEVDVMMQMPHQDEIRPGYIAQAVMKHAMGSEETQPSKS